MDRPVENHPPVLLRSSCQKPETNEWQQEVFLTQFPIQQKLIYRQTPYANPRMLCSNVASYQRGGAKRNKEGIPYPTGRRHLTCYLCARVTPKSEKQQTHCSPQMNPAGSKQRTFPEHCRIATSKFPKTKTCCFSLCSNHIY